MKRFNIFFALIVLIPATLSTDKVVERQKTKKQFSLFTIVNFPNDQCDAASDGTQKGICYTSSECTSKGGKHDGNCAAGFGACCLFITSTCGSTVSENCTYLRNPSYSSTYSTTGACSYSVSPLSSEICQLRLDFVDFSITDTDTTGACVDSLEVSGPTGRNPFTLCGDLTGQHLYVENGRSTAAISVKVTIGTGGGGKWSMKTSQIECSNLARGQPDCNQYFTGISGTFSSYNHLGSTQLKNTDFSYCFRREHGYCAIQFSTTSPTTATAPDPFETSSANPADTGNAAVTAKGYLYVHGTQFGGVYGGEVLTNTYTGTAAQKTDAVLEVPPGHQFKIHHIMLNADSGGDDGFSLQYTQIPCGVRTIQSSQAI